MLGSNPEMEFLDINLTKDWILLFYANKRKRNEGRKPDKNSNLRRFEFIPRNVD
jgi:hypothetical protein